MLGSRLLGDTSTTSDKQKVPVSKEKVKRN